MQPTKHRPRKKQAPRIQPLKPQKIRRIPSLRLRIQPITRPTVQHARTEYAFQTGAHVRGAFAELVVPLRFYAGDREIHVRMRDLAWSVGGGVGIGEGGGVRVLEGGGAVDLCGCLFRWAEGLGAGFGREGLLGGVSLWVDCGFCGLRLLGWSGSCGLLRSGRIGKGD